MKSTRRVNSAILSLLCSVLLPGAMSPRAFAGDSLPQTAPQQESTLYRIQNGDGLEIGVVGEPDVLRQVNVLSDGTISYPYAGDLFVRGLTLSQLRQKLTVILSKQFVKPEVFVNVLRTSVATVNVIGAVKTPGQVPHHEGMRLLDALIAVGGLTVGKPSAVSVRLLPKGTLALQDIDIEKVFNSPDSAANIVMKPGDSLLVNERANVDLQFQVLGQVAKQGVYPTTDRLSIVTAISLAGGVTDRAALSKAVIQRGQKNIPVDLRPLLHPTDAVASPAVQIEPGDTLFVPANDLTFSVVGAVNHEGAIPYPEEGKLDVLQALFLAGGQDTTADLKNAVLIKYSANTPAKQVGTKVNLSEQIQQRSQGTIAPATVTVEPGDVLFIPSVKRPRYTLAEIGSVVAIITLLIRLRR